MDLRLVVHRGLTIAIATSLSLVPVALLVLAVWPKLLTDLDGQERALLLAATVAATLLVPITRDFASRILDRYVYRTQANYRRTVTQASQMLTRVLDLRTLLEFISRTVMNSTGAEGVAIYLRGEAGEFRLATADKRDEVTHFERPSAAPAEILTALGEVKEPVLADEVARESGEPAAVLHARLSRANWSLLLPVLADDGLIGVVALGPKRSGDPFYPQDLDLLMTLANQAGIAVKNAQLYAQVVLANEYIENIIATIESGVVAMDAAGRVTMFNRAAETLTGLSAPEVKGRAVDTLPAALATSLRAAAADGGPRTIPEIALPRAGGGATETRPVICTMSPLREPAGAVLGAVAVFSDLTPLKELEAARRRAERLAYFELLASGIAHEIKNPLVSIKTFAQLLPRRRHDDRFVEDFGRIADREIGRMEQLLERLRRLARPHGRPHQPLDVRGPLQEALESLQAAFVDKDIDVVVALGTQPVVIAGDHNDLESLFLNLLLNAHEAMAPGGALTVALERGEGGATITVADSGPGVPPELAERIFDPFFTTKPRGSGLGLALCAGIAQAHGARLQVANRPQGGAAFTVELPLGSGVPSPVRR
jgi:PAS domain S-box-containing protein